MAESQRLNYKRGIATALFQMGAMYADQGDTTQALENYKKVLLIAHQLNDKQDLAHAYQFIGDLYTKLHNVPKAMESYQKTIAIYKELNDERRLCNTYANIGAMYKENKDYVNSLKNYQKSLSMAEELKMEESVKELLDCIGMVYLRLGDAEKAQEYVQRALKMAESMNTEASVYLIYWSYIRLTRVYMYQKNFKQAKVYSDKAIEIENAFDVSIRWEIEKNASQIDSALGNGMGAFEHYKRYIILRDKLKSEEVHKLAMKDKFQNDYDKQKAAEKIEQDKKDAVTRIIIWSVAGGLFIVIIFAGFIFRSLRTTRKQKRIIEEQKQLVEEANEELNQQNEEISAQRDVVTNQKEQIEKIHLEVTQSINYATRIQVAILPETELLNQNLSDYFVLFKPKDKVSGDFYWWAKVENQLIVTVADCTGHGVPGAFMSMLGISFLREIVIKEYITNPAIILKRLRKEIIHALKQKGEFSEQKDGMDMTLISVNTETLEMQFAGANNPIYIVRKSVYSGSEKSMEDNYQHSDPVDFGFRLDELKGDKMPVAIYENMQSFTNQELLLEKGDCLYLMSDGYQDQFGGPRYKKFLSKNLRKLILENCYKPMGEQRKIYESTIVNWIGNNEQVDDITFMGIKI
jgi:serine phosphatase RsbU (regulator of sigma subunit)/Tfp pilus assembly protein PilF